MAHFAHYKEAHPLPFVITHWINLVCMVGLIFTGFMIHFPYLPYIMGVVRGVHMLCAFVILINLAVRVIMAFFVKTAQVNGTRVKGGIDIKNFLPSKMNRHQWVQWIRYYLFLKRDHPIGTKYGSPQKLVYFAVPFVLLLSAFTGFCLWEPTAGPLQGIINTLGGPMNIRVIHYFLMWAFIIFMIIHIYLATIDGPASAKIMFLHKESGGKVADPNTGRVIGEDKGDAQVSYDYAGWEPPSKEENAVGPTSFSGSGK